MAKLIGTDPNQVPTNADLGTAAYVDLENTTVKNQIVQYVNTFSHNRAKYALTADAEQLLMSLSIKPKFSNSHMSIRVTWHMGVKDNFSDCGFAIRREIDNTFTGFVGGTTVPDSTRGTFVVDGVVRAVVFTTDDAPKAEGSANTIISDKFHTNTFSVNVTDTYSGTDERTYKFTGGTAGGGRYLHWNTQTESTSQYLSGGACSIEIMEIRQ